MKRSFKKGVLRGGKNSPNFLPSEKIKHSFMRDSYIDMDLLAKYISSSSKVHIILYVRGLLRGFLPPPVGQPKNT